MSYIFMLRLLTLSHMNKLEKDNLDNPVIKWIHNWLENYSMCLSMAHNQAERAFQMESSSVHCLHK